MPEQIPTEAVQTLMRLGMTNPGPERDRLLANVTAWEFVNRLHWNDWEPILEPLKAAGHEALGKGLVVAEETHHWCGGSVAAAIWVYRAFERKFPEAADALADWMLVHSSNPWVPFGRDRGSARSIVECRSLLETWRERKKRTEDIELGRTELKAAKEGVRKRVSMAEKRHTASAADTELPIKSRDYWFKIVDFLQQNWALIDPASIGCRVWFFSDTSGVFDQLDFSDVAIAEGALRRNGFARFDEDPEAAAFLYKPQPPFVRRPHSNGPIYSSGRFWK
jgi:hypothetical protein